MRREKMRQADALRTCSGHFSLTSPREMIPRRSTRATRRRGHEEGHLRAAHSPRDLFNQQFRRLAVDAVSSYLVSP